MALRLRVTWEQGCFCTLRAEKSWSLDDLKSAIEAAAGFGAQEQRLFHDGGTKGFVELSELEPLRALRGSADVLLVRCHPRRHEWKKRLALHWEALESAPRALQEDLDIVLVALQQHGSALAFAAPALRADRELVLFAVGQHAEALEFASEDLRDDWDLVWAALGHDLNAVRFASDAIRADRQLMLEAVGQRGELLEFASQELRADREVVLVAVQCSGKALEFAAEELRGDREVIMAAVRGDPYALEFVADGFVADHEILQVALGDAPAAPQAKQPPPPAEPPPERRPAEAAELPKAYRWMGLAKSALVEAPSEAAAAEPEERAVAFDEADLDEDQRLEVAVHWRFDAPTASFVHRFAKPTVCLTAPPPCEACRLGRQLWCGLCGPASLPAALYRMREVERQDRKTVLAEEGRVLHFLGAGLSYSSAVLRTSAFKGVPS